MVKPIVQVWQFNSDYLRSESDQALGITAINLKTHDGVSFMSQFDKNPDGSTHAQAVASGAKFRQLMNVYKENEIELTPWCVPTGLNVPVEIERASAIIEVCNSMVFDVEIEASPYFYKGGPSQIVAYMGELRRRFPTARFTMQIDGRPTNFPANAQVWAQYMNDVVSMSYWTDFKRGPQSVLVEAANQMSTLGLPYGFTYPGDTVSIPKDPMGEAMSGSLDRIYIYRRANLSDQMVQWLHSQVVEEKDVEVTPPVVDTDYNKKITDLYTEQVRQAVEIQKLKEVLRSV